MTRGKANAGSPSPSRGKMSCKELKDTAKEESDTSKKYAQSDDRRIRGFAKDEAKHSKYFDQKAKKECGKMGLKPK